MGSLWAVLHVIALLGLAGLQRRWTWTPILDLEAHLAGGLIFVLGSALFSWAMLSNTLFSSIARVQEDRGHRVCSTGPYRFVRHPGYVGAILQSTGIPLLLGSLWALIPGALASGLMVVRTFLEDRMLHAELEGYPEYAARVRHRLVPGIW